MTTALTDTEVAESAWQRRHAARQASIQARLDEMEAVYRDAINVELNQIVEEFGWPADFPQEMYVIRWTRGTYADHTIAWGEAYASEPTPDAKGFLLTIGCDGPVCMKIEAQTIETTAQWWRTIDDVPKRLKVCVRRACELRVYELNDRGDAINWHARLVSESVSVLCRGLRQEFGGNDVEALPIDGVSDYDREHYGAKLVSVGLKPDGTFVPWSPPREGGAR